MATQNNNSITNKTDKTNGELIFFKNAPSYDEIHTTTQEHVSQPINTTPIDPNTNNIVNTFGSEKNMASVTSKLLSDLDENIKQTEPTDAENIEEIVTKYIKLLDPADKYYLKYQQIYENGEKYIQYLKSSEYIQYRKDRKALESRYSNNKRYTVEVTKKKVIVYKKDSEGKTDKTTRLDELTRPTYIDLLEIFDKTHKNITQTRLKLRSLYNQLINRPFVKFDVKNKFIKQRDNMITKLNEFYSIQYYYNKINGNVQTEKQVALPKITSYYSENKQEIVPRLTAKYISVAPEELQNLYDNGMKKLELYNNINEILLTNTDNKQDLKGLIKQYINFDKEQQQELLNKIEKKKSHQPINYIVIPPGLEIPMDNSIISPRDMRPFFAMRKKTTSS